MSMETITTGNIAEPTLRYTQAGKAVLELRIGATRRAFNKQTNEWEDDGADFYAVAAWRQLAENVAESITKGMEVIVTFSEVLSGYVTVSE